jgi:60 kDa SS-A/Ro ribonucleoprotein
MFNTLNNALRPPTQREPLPGQVANSAGGYSWKVDKWIQLERFLILGTTGGTYYIKESDLTKENLEAVQACLDEDGVKTIAKAVELSEEGRTLKNDCAIYVLAMAIADKKYSDTIKAAYAAITKVCRTFTHLSHLLGFVKAIRKANGLKTKSGMGYRRAIANWYNSKDVKSLAFQVLKYQSRDGYSQHDIYRICHPKEFVKELSVGRKELYDYLFYWGEKAIDKFTDPDLIQLAASIAIKGNREEISAAKTISLYHLPIECVPSEKQTAEVYRAVLETAGLTWIVRNLGNLAKHKITDDKEARKFIQDRLTDENQLAKARLHPLDIMKAMVIYKQGKGDKSESTWTPHRDIVDTLDDAFRKAFKYAEPSGKRILYGVDVSGSMTYARASGLPMSVHEAAAIIAMVSMATEPETHLLAFDVSNYPMSTISPKQRVDDIAAAFSRFDGGGTDISLPFAYANYHKIPVDLFVILTDSETWAGQNHPKHLLEDYRNKMGINAKAINVCMTGNTYSTMDQSDPRCLEIVGFDTVVPKVISTFAKLEV